MDWGEMGKESTWMEGALEVATWVSYSVFTSHFLFFFSISVSHLQST